MAREKAQYITCQQGHKVFVIWSDVRQCFGFTCEECDQHSETAVSLHGLVRVTLVRQPVAVVDYKQRAGGDR